jgi:hypothetical protein
MDNETKLTVGRNGTLILTKGSVWMELPTDGRRGALYCESATESVWMGGASWDGRKLRTGGLGFGDIAEEGARILRAAKVRRAG